MGIKDFFASEFETSDNHSNNKLRTRYYRCSYKDSKEAINQLIKSLKGFNVIINDNFQEISFQTNRYICIFSIINTRPMESAIDIKLSFNGISLGKGFIVIQEMYVFLDKQLQYKGTSLYKG